jgi:hypothetical protein
MEDVGEDDASGESEADLEDAQEDVALIQHAKLSL